MAIGPEVFRSLGAYLKAQLQNATIMTGLYIVGFAVLGIPWWPVAGFVCGILNIIPYFGSLAALAIALLLKWGATENWVHLLYVGAFWVLLQAFEGFVLSPRAAGRAGVNPFLSILITLVAGFAFGPLGILFAIPVTAILLIVYRTSRKRAATIEVQRPVRGGTVQR